MKRIKSICVIAFCALAFVSKAQESSLPEGFTSGNTVWIARAGISLNNVSGSGIEDIKAAWAATKGAGDFKNTLGGAVSFGLYSPLAPSSFYFGVSLSAGMRGYRTSVKWKEGVSSLNAQTTKLTAFNAQIAPTCLGYIAKLSHNTALDFHVGMFVSYDFAGSFEIEDEYSGHSQKSSSININDDEDYEYYDIGFMGGIGLWINHWVIDLNYQRGIATMEKSGYNLYSNVFLLNLGYAF